MLQPCAQTQSLLQLTNWTARCFATLALQSAMDLEMIFAAMLMTSAFAARRRLMVTLDTLQKQAMKQIQTGRGKLRVGATL